MHALRTSSLLARLVLAWFALMLGIAFASPVVKASNVELVCTMGGGMKMVVSDDGSTVDVSRHTFDCPMCLGLAAPVPPVQVRADLPQPMAHALLPLVQAHIAGIVGAPLPPRGPPALF